MSNKKIVFFDLDGTILSGISSENVFILYLFTHGYIGIMQLFKSFIFTFRWMFKYGKQVFVKNKAYLAGLPKKEIIAIGEKMVREKLLKKLRPLLRQRIEEHRVAGDILVLLTGSLEFLAKIFAHELGIEHVEASHLAKSEHFFSHHPPEQHPYGKEKVTVALKVCEKYHIPIKDCVAYGNSIHDEAILAAVGRAIAVTPDKQLAKIAKQRGWEIISLCNQT